jgi:hypothetical protein
MISLILFYLCIIVVYVQLNVDALQHHRINSLISNRFNNRLTLIAYNANGDTFFDDERVNDMTLDEIKAELDLRSVNYEDCFSKKELVAKLGSARRDGKAAPDIFNSFNEISNDDIIKNLDSDKGMIVIIS